MIDGPGTRAEGSRYHLDDGHDGIQTEESPKWVHHQINVEWREWERTDNSKTCANPDKQQDHPKHAEQRADAREWRTPAYGNSDTTQDDAQLDPIGSSQPERQFRQA